MSLAVLLNAPPGAGKDTIATLMQMMFHMHKLAFKDQLYLETIAHYDLDEDQADEFLRRAVDRQLKEEPWEVTGDTPRWMLIETSEKYIKPTKGPSFFGDSVVERVKQMGYEHIVLSDSGFPEETQPLIDHFDRVVICRLHREGYTFDGDSRNYLEGFPDTHDFTLIEGNPGATVMEILEVIVDDLLQQDYAGAKEQIEQGVDPHEALQNVDEQHELLLGDPVH